MWALATNAVLLQHYSFSNEMLLAFCTAFLQNSNKHFHFQIFFHFHF